MTTMNKKNIFAFLLMALPALLLTSCLKDQDDVFDDSASARTAKYLANAKKVLTSSKDGWLLNYYPDREQSYGGCTYVLKFDDQNVTVFSELADAPADSVVSTYILNNEDGPCLMFDTYNELMHFFATPSGSSGAGGYEAYDGDFLFIIMNISDDQNTITLKGSRSGNMMYMHRMTSSGSDYIAKVLEIQENMPLNYQFNNGNDTVDIVLAGGNASFSADTISETIAYIYTDEGIEFYQPFTIDDVELKGIKFGGEAETTTAIGSDLQLKVIFLPINEIFVANDWYISYANMGPVTQSYFDYAIAGSQAEGETISMMVFTDINGFSLYFVSGRYAGALAFDTEFIGEDQIKLTYNGDNNYSNGNWYYKNAGYDKLLTPLERTFTLESNSKVRPTVVKMVDVENPDNYLLVTTSAAAF